MQPSLKISEEAFIYRADQAAAFRRNKDRYGGLSNMASGFPIQVNGLSIRTSEALYQACRFPDHPAVQEKIITTPSPMAAKHIGRQNLAKTRKDWFDYNVAIMWWCLRAKLLCHPDLFGTLLKSTGTLYIVESSAKDDFWGAKPVNGTFIGRNVLGRLLKALRAAHDPTKPLEVLLPPEIPNFKLMGELIRPLNAKALTTEGYYNIV